MRRPLHIRGAVLYHVRQLVEAGFPPGIFLKTDDEPLWRVVGSLQLNG